MIAIQTFKVHHTRKKLEIKFLKFHGFITFDILKNEIFNNVVLSYKHVMSLTLIFLCQNCQIF